MPMTDEHDTTRGDDRQAPPKGDISTGTERAFVRLTFWQTVLSLVGVFIAVIALYAALAESDAARKQIAAAVWLRRGLEVPRHHFQCVHPVARKS